MGTRALVGYYTKTEAGPSWRAVWVHYDAYPLGPHGLGAQLVKAVRLFGGDPQPALDDDAVLDPATQVGVSDARKSDAEFQAGDAMGQSLERSFESRCLALVIRWLGLPA